MAICNRCLTGTCSEHQPKPDPPFTFWSYYRVDWDLIRDDSEGALNVVPAKIWYSPEDAKRAANLDHLLYFNEVFMFESVRTEDGSFKEVLKSDWEDPEMYIPLKWEKGEDGGYYAKDDDYIEWLVYPVKLVFDPNVPDVPKEEEDADTEVG